MHYISVCNTNLPQGLSGKKICEKKFVTIKISEKYVTMIGGLWLNKFNFGDIRRWDQCAVYILHSKISTDPGLPKTRHSHRFVAVVIQIFIKFRPLREPIRIILFIADSEFSHITDVIMRRELYFGLRLNSTVKVGIGVFQNCGLCWQMFPFLAE